MRDVVVVLLLVLDVGLGVGLGACRPVLAQGPQPFPKPVDQQKPAAQTPPKVEPPQKPGVATPPAVAPAVQAPTAATLGLPIFPSAEFIASYDAGRGQRYYLFGTNNAFAQIVEYYRTILKQRGELVYDEPPIHMFEVGRFREETMAFMPGVTIKDYGWAGSLGYLNPKRGAEPARFKTIIQIVPAPAGAPK
jgi:hypothetical protein